MCKSVFGKISEDSSRYFSICNVRQKMVREYFIFSKWAFGVFSDSLFPFGDKVLLCSSRSFPSVLSAGSAVLHRPTQLDPVCKAVGMNEGLEEGFVCKHSLSNCGASHNTQRREAAVVHSTSFLPWVDRVHTFNFCSFKYFDLVYTVLQEDQTWSQKCPVVCYFWRLSSLFPVKFYRHLVSS